MRMMIDTHLNKKYSVEGFSQSLKTIKIYGLARWGEDRN